MTLSGDKSPRRIAVVLFNLGGPDGADSIRPFLRHFFTDRNIIPLPYPLRRIIAELIAQRRSRKEAGSAYAMLGGVSPLLENTRLQADALQDKLDRDGRDGTTYKVFICMRYWHPMTRAVVGQVASFDPDEIVLLPLYPQFSTTTTRSSFQQWFHHARAARLDVPTSTLCCYPTQSGWVSASSEILKALYLDALAQAGAQNLPAPRVLFSAHGLPESVIRAGDPYQYQCEQSARAIVARTGIADMDWRICYQSRIGPKKWIGPSTSEAIEEAARDKTGILIIPHAFVSEHVETLVEIEIEYRHLAEKLGVPFFRRVPTVGTHKLFIGGLFQMVEQSLSRKQIASDQGKAVCPEEFGACCMRDPAGLRLKS